ncbi:beta-galactosidase GalA [Maribacter ulvicola]|uniref:Beta-galactosidase n=1 Tax=Maribacter ulvicola TaxID=228959 RepID=A0A1N6X7T7_9FLAO|nr:beta-galactosidase GalA [Maribacter ulvicola]SIQ98327.1 beta-galactosidase [Maribacter ulvicola]
MQKSYVKGFFTFILLLTSLGGHAQRETIPLLDGWKFHLGHSNDIQKDFGFGTGTKLQFAKLEPFGHGSHGIPSTSLTFDDSKWETVEVPHDWSIGLPYDSLQNPEMGNRYGYKPVGREYPETSIGWYRKKFNVSEQDKKKIINLRFDGVFRNSMVWVNGFFIGRNWGGYNGFEMDISDYLLFGKENIVSLRVDATLHEGWFYEGAGIQKEVYLIKSNKVHIDNYEPYITTTTLPNGDVKVAIETNVINEDFEDCKVSLMIQVLDPWGKEVVSDVSKLVQIPLKETLKVNQKVIVQNPKLWTLSETNRYTLVSTLKRGEYIVDQIRTKFGIRSIHFDADKGFHLNGKRVQINGACVHQNFAGVGSGIPEAMHYYRLNLLKEMGVNAVRSHYPFSPKMLEACDSLGILVMDETRATGSTKESLEQLESMILRDRNHPSIFMWSMANEEGGTQRNSIGKRYMRTMVAHTHKLDPSRRVTAGVNAWGSKADYGFAEEIDVMGFNYSLEFIDQYHKDHPNQPIIGTEVGNATVTRGVYALNSEGIKVEDGIGGYYTPEGDFEENKKFDQHIAANNVKTNSSAYNAVKFYASREYLAGSFLWTGFDYHGETWPSSYPNNSSQFGAMDIAGFPKDIYYYYQSWWTDKEVMHIANHWNWEGREGVEVPILIHSNADKVTLFLNGKKLETKEMKPYDYLLFKVKFKKGTLKAVGYKNGKKVSEDKIRTSSAPHAIRLMPNKTTLKANGKDMVFVRAEIVDKKGIPVSLADNEISFEVEGDAKILGAHNGNPSSYELGNSSSRKAFNGKCLVVLKAGNSKGNIKIKAIATNMQRETLVLSLE